MTTQHSTQARATLRDATAADGEQLTAMVRASAAYDGTYRVMVERQTIDATYIRQHPVRVAELDGTPAGFYTLQISGNEAELDFMFVANDKQGLGLGRLLFTDLRQQANARGLTRIHIVAHPPAEPFYRAVGARVVGRTEPAGRVTWSRPVLVLDL